MRVVGAPFPRWRLIYLRDLLRELVVRDMKLRYKRSVLGLAWSLLNPLAQLLVFNFVFRLVLPVNIPKYSSFLFSGLLAWNWFTSSLLLGAGAMVDNRDLVKRPGFPVAVLPTARVTCDLVHYLLALPVLLLFLIWDGTRLTMAIVALPVVIALQFAVTLGLVYLIATVHVVFRDTQYLLGVMLQMMFFLTPVFYDPSGIRGRLRAVYYINPMTHILGAYRAILLEGRLPNPEPMLILSVFAAVLLSVAYIIFMRASVRFVDEL